MNYFSLQSLTSHISILHGLRDFLKYGKTYPKQGFDTKGLLILFLFKFCLITVYILILDIMDVGDFDHKFEAFLKESPYLILILVGIVAPLWEELIFRYPLNLKKKGLLTALVMSAFMAVGDLWPVMVGYMLFLIWMFVSSKIGKPLHIKWIVYISSAFFAIIHLGNFEDLDYLGYWYLMPLLVLTQFFGGLILCFLRLSHGLWLAIYFHAFWNILLISLVLWAGGVEVG
ncbi:CPBP family intramembrane glutamic endopeptidase [Litoribacter populi]|uniref:CPBP family intramembrane glutamic endopeptidase n=1 Tax=Litoribacter populi TaxID=2598460 RepID=UPI00117E1683|nr:CPBP family intramembrane glutamic endopeptidase [Litoribacter populi]